MVFPEQITIGPGVDIEVLREQVLATAAALGPLLAGQSPTATEAVRSIERKGEAADCGEPSFEELAQGFLISQYIGPLLSISAIETGDLKPGGRSEECLVLLPESGLYRVSIASFKHPDGHTDFLTPHVVQVTPAVLRFIDAIYADSQLGIPHAGTTVVIAQQLNSFIQSR